MDTIDPLSNWLEALRARHTAQLRFTEIRRGLQALSTTYVAKRDKLAGGGAFDGAGKRAAFALFYTPLHALAVRAICQALAPRPAEHVWDLGCGAGAASLGWCFAVKPATVVGIDVNAWALSEARWNWRTLGLNGGVQRRSLLQLPSSGAGHAMVLGYAVNELPDAARDTLQQALCRAARSGTQILVVEPIAKTVTPWWARWESMFKAEGGRSDIWRLPLRLPEPLRLLSRAAGLDHREVTARSLFVGR